MAMIEKARFAGGQFSDRGSQYHTAIFYHNSDQRKSAENSKATLAKKLGRPIYVVMLKASTFYPAEAHHQSYYKQCSLQYEVTQQCGTEKPFQNEYWNNHEEGVYVDVVSGSGWPSFTKPLSKDEVKEVIDNSKGMQRVEVKSRSADSHLGHVFKKKDLDHAGYGEYNEYKS